MEADGPKTLYALAKGEYSDYQVLAVFDDEKTADEIKALANGGERYGEYDVEEMPYYEYGTKPKRSSWYVSAVKVKTDGSLDHEDTVLLTQWPWDFRHPEPGNTVAHPNHGIRDVEYRVTAAHPKKSMAEKRASDKAAKLAAELIEKKEED